MKLTITTPTGIIAEQEDVVSLRAEDATGSFAILQGHADFTTVLETSVISWQYQNKEMNYCAVRKGILSVSGRNNIFIATREAIRGKNLEDLRNKAITDFASVDILESKAKLAQERLQAEAMKNIQRYLHQEEHAG